MLFRKFVQVGRVALINYGPDTGKLATIIDVIDENRVLVDGPVSVTGVVRQAVPIRWIALTDYVLKIPHSCSIKILEKAFVDAKIMEKWAKTKWAQKLKNRVARRHLTDFDRFKKMVYKKTVNGATTLRSRTLLREHRRKMYEKRLEVLSKQKKKTPKPKKTQAEKKPADKKAEKKPADKKPADKKAQPKKQEAKKPVKSSAK